MKAQRCGIYKITSPTGKIYIGQTKDLKRRIRDYRNGSPRQPKLFNSIQKHGWNAHKIELVHELPEDISQEVIDNYEIFYWEAYRDIGFNILNLKEPGGDGKHSEESLETMRQKRLNFHRNNPDIAQSLLKPIIQIEKSGKVTNWNSLKEASEKLGISYSTVKRSLRKGTKTINGSIFKYK